MASARQSRKLDAMAGSAVKPMLVREIMEAGKVVLELRLEVDAAWRVLRRQADGQFEQTVARLGKLAQKKDKTAKRRKGVEAQRVEEIQERLAAVTVRVLAEGGEPLANAEALTNAEVLRERGQVLEVQPLGSFAILNDHPEVKSLEVRGRALVGCPVAPVAEEMFTDATTPRRWVWTACGPAAEGATEVGHERVYVPTSEDVGKMLSVRMEVGDEDQFPSSSEAKLGEPVAETPDRAVHEARQADIGSRTADDTAANRLVVATYNILADAYSHTWDEMYDYCSPEHRDMAYRFPLLAREVLDYNADVICLQEVDAKMFPSWESVLGASHEGRFTPKAGKVLEGCALFWRRDALELAEWEDVCFRDRVQAVLADQAWLRNLLEAVPSMRETLAHVTSIAQVATLRQRRADKADGQQCAVLVANTHSFYHPGAGSIRVVQAKLLTDMLTDRMRAREAAGERTGVLLCGDLNAQSFDLSLKFLLDGEVGPEHSEWATSSLFEWGSNANLARDKVFSEGGTAHRAPDVLVQRTESGRLRSVDELAAQVAAIDEKHEWSGMVNVVAELRTRRDMERQAGNQAEFKRAVALLEQMSQHLESSRRLLILQQAARVAAAGDAAGQDGAVVGVGARLRHELGLVSACGEPPYTNFCRSWTGDIDWILFSKDRFAVRRFTGVPAEATLREHVALPSVAFPSDHISLACELEFQSPEAGTGA